MPHCLGTLADTQGNWGAFGGIAVANAPGSKAVKTDRKAPIWLVSLVLAVIVIALIAFYAWPHWAQIALWIDATRRLKASAAATDNIKAILVSMGGAIFGATAIGISLSVFFIGQNIQRLHYVTFQRVYSLKRIVLFVLCTTSLGATDYVLAGIITRANAYAAACGAVGVGAIFIVILLRFFGSSMNLLDPKIAIETAFENYEKDATKIAKEFDVFLNQEAQKVTGKAPDEILMAGKDIQDQIVDFAMMLRKRADLFVEEVIPIAINHARNGDYRNVEMIVDAICKTCRDALKKIDRIFLLFGEKMSVDITDRLGLYATFSRLSRITRYAADQSDTHLYRLLSAKYAELGKSIAPGKELSEANQYNAYAILSEIRHAALKFKPDELSEPCTIALNAFAESVDTWTEEFSSFPWLIKDAVPELALAALDNDGGEYSFERALNCLVATMRRGWALPADRAALLDISKTMENLIASLATRRETQHASKKRRQVLDPVVSSTAGFERNRMMKVVEDACLPYFHAFYAQSPMPSDLPRVIDFLAEHLRLLQSIGESTAATSLAPYHTEQVAKSILECLALCINIRNVLPPNYRHLRLLDGLIQRKLDSLPKDLEKLSAVDLNAFFLDFYFGKLVMLTHGNKIAAPDMILAVVSTCLNVALLFLKPEYTFGTDRLSPSGSLIFLAVGLSALDPSGRSLAAVSDSLRSGLWAQLAASNPEASNDVRGLLVPLDEKSFLEEESHYSMPASQKKELIAAVGFDRVRLVFGEALAVIEQAAGASANSG